MPALFLAILIGCILGALGSGGAILTLPLLVHVAGLPPAEAVATSTVVVGCTSLIAAWLHYRQGHFHARATALLGATGLAGAYVGAGFTHLVRGPVLMTIFAGVMLAAAVAILLPRPGLPQAGRCRVLPCIALGLGIGLLTGFLGVGGGFLIVPVLVVQARIETRKAVGASLAVIAMNSFAGFAHHVRHADVDAARSLGLLAATAAGMVVGVALAGRLPVRALRAGFAVLLVTLAGFVAATYVPQL